MKKLILLLFIPFVLLLGCSETPTKSPEIFNKDQVVVSPDDGRVYLKEDMNLINGIVLSYDNYIQLGKIYQLPDKKKVNDRKYRIWGQIFPLEVRFTLNSMYKDGIKEGIQRFNLYGYSIIHRGNRGSFFELGFDDEFFFVNFEKGDELVRNKYLEKRNKFVNTLFPLGLSDRKFLQRINEYDNQNINYEISQLNPSFVLSKKYNLSIGYEAFDNDGYMDVYDDVVDDVDEDFYSGETIYSETIYSDSDPPFGAKTLPKVGNLMLEYNIKNEKLDGFFSEWYIGGRQLMTKRKYKDGKLDGLLSEWYPDGQIKSKINYIDGKLVNGECWNNNGAKIDCKEQSLLKSLFFELLDNELYSDEEGKIKLKDGVLIDKEKFVKSCQNSFSKQTPEANNFLNVKGLCDCMAEVIGKYLTSSEIMKYANVYDISQILSDKSDLWENGMVIFEKMAERGYNNECIVENTINKSGNYNIDDEEGERKVLLNYLEKTYLPKLLKAANMTETEFSSLINKNGFLNCILTKIYGDYSYYEIMNSSEKQRDERMDKISEECINDNAIN